MVDHMDNPSFCDMDWEFVVVDPEAIVEEDYPALGYVEANGSKYD